MRNKIKAVKKNLDDNDRARKAVIYQKVSFTLILHITYIVHIHVLSVCSGI